MTAATSPNSAYADAKSVDLDYIPVIDLADLMADKRGAVEDVAQQIVDASTRIGFFYVKNHGVPQDVIDRASKAMRDYFALSPEQKALAPVNTSQRGWMATGMAKLEGSKTHDLKEIFFWGPEQWHPRLNARKGVDSLVADNVWPDSFFPALRKDLLPYYDEIHHVGLRLLSAIAIGLKRPAEFFQTKYTSPMARGQLVYYPVSTTKDESEERFGSAPHTDFGVLTLLLQDMNGGLQVQNRAGEWVAATPIPGTLVCNIGDLLNRWSNETLSSNLHRVINRSGNERHSIAIFFDPDPDAIVDPTDLGFPEGTERFPPITASDYIHSKNKKNFTQYK